jgi:hypothetical protein
MRSRNCLLRAWGLIARSARGSVDHSSVSMYLPPPDAVATGQPRTNRLIPILQRKPRHRDCKWQDQGYPAQDHEFARVAAMNKVRNDIYERYVSDVKGVRELAAELAKPHHALPLTKS